MRGNWRRLTCCAGFLPFPDDDHMIRRLQTEYPNATQRILDPMIPGVGSLQFAGAQKQLVLVSAIPETPYKPNTVAFPPPLATASFPTARRPQRLDCRVSQQPSRLFGCRIYFIPPKVKSSSARCPSIAITWHHLFVSVVLFLHQIISAGLLNFSALAFAAFF